MSKAKDLVPSSSREIEAFLRTAATLPATGTAKARLVFGLDATASRERMWDQACQLQADMFEEAAHIGGLEIQVCYYRGNREFNALPWTLNAQSLARGMGDVRCRAGTTQISRVFTHALAETGRKPLQALVFVGDAVEEPPELLYDLAGKLAIQGVPAFLFQEGAEPDTRAVFERMARLTRGAYASFDASSAQRLRQLLCAVAVYASGGLRALEHFSRSGNNELKTLTSQLKGKS